MTPLCQRDLPLGRRVFLLSRFKPENNGEMCTSTVRNGVKSSLEGLLERLALLVVISRVVATLRLLTSTALLSIVC